MLIIFCCCSGNPTYTPEVLTKTTMVNFAVKEQGLQAQLLGHVVRKEVPQLELMKDNLVVTIAKNKKTLVRTPILNKNNMYYYNIFFDHSKKN